MIGQTHEYRTIVKLRSCLKWRAICRSTAASICFLFPNDWLIKCTMIFAFARNVRQMRSFFHGTCKTAPKTGPRKRRHIQRCFSALSFAQFFKYHGFQPARPVCHPSSVSFTSAKALPLFFDRALEGRPASFDQGGIQVVSEHGRDPFLSQMEVNTENPRSLDQLTP